VEGGGGQHSHRVSIFHPYIYTRSEKRERASKRERSAPSGVVHFGFIFVCRESGAPRLVCSIIIIILIIPITLHIIQYSAPPFQYYAKKPVPECVCEVQLCWGSSQCKLTRVYTTKAQFLAPSSCFETPKSSVIAKKQPANKRFVGIHIHIFI